MKNNQILCCAFLLGLFIFGNPVKAQVRTSKIFNDHMVIQRDVQVPVWGWAGKGEKIGVKFNGKTYNTKADKSGKWKVILPAEKAGGPHSISITGKSNSIDFEDIMVGDVWVCSGQSNMAWTVVNSNDAENEIANANDSQIRHFTVPRSAADKPEEELAGGDWQVSSSETVGQFTAVGYFFARELRQHIDVAIGLLNTSWGGSRVEPWMSAEALGIDDAAQVLQNFTKKREAQLEKMRADLKQKFGDIPEYDPGLIDGKAYWADPDLDDANWSSAELPGLWEQNGFPGLDGIVWYRKTFELTEDEVKDGIEIGLGKIDDSDISWINSREIGSMENSYNAERVYQVDAAILRSGRNVIAVRVEDTGGGGGVYGEPGLLYLKSRAGTTSLAGDWKIRIGTYTTNVSVKSNQIPTLLYNKMVYPILDFPIKGALWYQGESNAGNREDAMKYRQLFPDMIKDWRSRWGVGDFPFLFVQLANFMAAVDQPAESNWALLREAQTATLELANTAQAVIIDIGEADDIHPRNKQDVGLRLSLGARKLAYEEQDLVYSGPVYRSHSGEDNKVVIEFDHQGSGLMVKDKYGYLKGFTIAGEDRKFVWAQALLENGRVTVWSDKVAKPVAVRYAWGNNPDQANLYNQEDLPATPFRTDSW